MQKLTAAEVLTELEGRPHTGGLSSKVKEKAVHMVVTNFNKKDMEAIDKAIDGARTCGDVTLASFLISAKNICNTRWVTAQRIKDLGGA